MKDNNESFFSRWSQRKAESRDQSEADVSTEDISKAPDENADEAQPIVEEQPELCDEDMPSLEDLNEESDFAQFFSPGVSEELRNLALRKLFMLPEFNLRDGLNDYDDDFSKMPELTQAVVAKLRSWVNDKGDELTEQLTEELQDASETPSEKSKITNIDPEDQAVNFSDIDSDELGDADLEG